MDIDQILPLVGPLVTMWIIYSVVRRVFRSLVGGVAQSAGRVIKERIVDATSYDESETPSASIPEGPWHVSTTPAKPAKVGGVVATWAGDLDEDPVEEFTVPTFKTVDEIVLAAFGTVTSIQRG